MSWLRDPLLQFLVLGALLVLVHRWFGPDPGPSADDITAPFDPATVVGTAPAEVHDRLIEDEVLYREALRLGLATDDLIVRRRLVQKMRFRLGDLATAREPTEAELADWLAAHPERWALETRTDLEHHFFGEKREDPRAEAQAAQKALMAGEPVRGESFIFGRSLKGADRTKLDAWFGRAAARAVHGLEVGRWSVVQSTYGWHVLRVTAREVGRAAELAEVRDDVRADWLAHQRASARRAAIAALRERYVR